MIMKLPRGSYPQTNANASVYIIVPPLRITTRGKAFQQKNAAYYSLISAKISITLTDILSVKSSYRPYRARRRGEKEEVRGKAT